MRAAPPRLARLLVTASLAAAEREPVLGDLAEEFSSHRETWGTRAARRWYWRQVWRSLPANVLRRLRPIRVIASPGMPDPPKESQLMEQLLQDLRFSWRTLRRRPVLTVVAVGSLTIGVMLATVVFSLLNAVLLRPLAVASPDDLAIVLESRSTGLNHNLSYLDFTDYRAQQTSFVDLAAHSRIDVMVRDAATRVVPAQLVSGGLMPMLGVRLRAGRTLVESDDRPGAPLVTVVSERLWRELAGRDIADGFAPRALQIGTRDFAVIGVVAGPFRGMQIGADVEAWLPLHAHDALEADATTRRARRTANWLSLIGRLRPGVSREQAAVDLNRIEAALAPSVGRRTPRALVVMPGRQGDSSLTQSAGAPLRLLFGATLLVLAVAAVNVTNLLLARATERTREMALRTALGARRGRLARLLFVDALLVAGAAAAIGSAAAPALAVLMVPLISDFGRPVTLDVSPDWRMLLFVLGATVATTVACSVGPIVSTLRGRDGESLTDAARGASAGSGTTRLRQGLVAVQFGVSLALVVGALLLVRTVHNLLSTDTGLDLEHVALIDVDPDAAQYDATRSAAFLSRALAAIEAVPGVRAAGYGRVVPLGFGGSRMGVSVPGYQPQEGEDMGLNFNVVSSGYLESIGARLLVGRWFDARDAATSTPVVVINQTMAERYWGGDAIGRSVVIDPSRPGFEIVGVVRDVKYRMVREDAQPSFYLPLTQSRARGGVLHVRTRAAPGPLLDTLRQAVAQADANVPITAVRTLERQMAANVTDERLAMVVAVTLGVAALVLAAVGLYGALAYAVSQRTREIGVRMALGAPVAAIRRMILAQSLFVALGGAAIGAGIGRVTAPLLEGRLFGVTPWDAATWTLAVTMLAGIAVVASLVPANHAAHIDPNDALRAE